jgi:acetyl-CoA acetyltransferase
MPEAVIVATGRTPIGRANKGSLVECRPDDLSALVLRTVLEQVPQLNPAEVEDVCSAADSLPVRRATTSPAWPPSWPGWTTCPASR